MNPITFEDVVLGLKKQVTLKGEDHVYGTHYVEGSAGRCVNWVDGHPSCIAGHYFMDLGVEPAPILAHYPADRVAEHAGIPFTPKAMELLSQAQVDQDRGIPWGEAVAGAILRVADIEGP